MAQHLRKPLLFKIIDYDIGVLTRLRGASKYSLSVMNGDLFTEVLRFVWIWIWMLHVGVSEGAKWYARRSWEVSWGGLWTGCEEGRAESSVGSLCTATSFATPGELSTDIFTLRLEQANSPFTVHLSVCACARVCCLYRFFFRWHVCLVIYKIRSALARLVCNTEDLS